jgi:NAD(P)H-flavin reductase
VTIVYGARSPKELLFIREYYDWRSHDIELIITVDHADEIWTGLVGVVPMYFYRLRPDAKNTILMSCGPEIMMHFVLYEALARKIPHDQIYLSYERNMKCGVGSCGHCQYGPYYICKEGPVFTYKELEPYFNVEDL